MTSRPRQGHLTLLLGAALVIVKYVLLSLNRPSGQDYWALMPLAGEYAYGGRSSS